MECIESLHQLPRLNLPPIVPELGRNRSGLTIVDPLRRKHVALTPEEWVRQHFTAFLIGHRGYPASLMANEVSIMLNGVRRRCDTVIFGRAMHPDVIVEYKAPDVTITEDTFRQVISYNMVLKARLLIVSNGLRHYCCLVDYANHTHRFLPDIPPYDR